MLSATSEAQALEDLHALGCTDGLPVVVPTRERVQRMVLACGLDGDLVLGEMGPANGIVSVEKIAVAAVMAGCLPDYMPLVVAAVKAVIDPRFDLTEMQATTHCTAPLIIVNGPARLTCGPVASGFGALGPGHRANASVGRALRLAMINIGGGRPGESDMALLGHPGKFTFCLAEDEEHSSLPPLHTSRGFAREDSVVTVIGAEAPHSALYSPVGDSAVDVGALVRVLAAGLANLATNNAVLRAGSATVVLNPDHAAVFTRANVNREGIQKALFEACTFSGRELNEVGGGFAVGGDDDVSYPCFRAAEDIIVLMAGGSGLYSMVMPSWCAGAHRNAAVSVLVELDQFCEVPGSVST